MPKLTLDLEELAVETFLTLPLDKGVHRPTLTREPGCTLPELCGGG